MKRLFSTIFLGVCFAAAALAQNLTITPPSVALTPSASQTDVHGDITMRNPAASAKTFKWERTVVSISPNCQTQVCDVNNCYLPSVSTKQFNLAAGATGQMQVHFLNSTGQTGCAVVHIKITEVGDTANTVTAIYLFNDCTLGSDEAVRVNARIFPNPTTDAFSLENVDNVQVVRVFGMDGREAKRFDAAAGSAYSVADLPAGTYIVVLQNAAGQALAATELKKN